MQRSFYNLPPRPPTQHETHFRFSHSAHYQHLRLTLAGTCCFYCWHSSPGTKRSMQLCCSVKNGHMSTFPDPQFLLLNLLSLYSIQNYKGSLHTITRSPAHLPSFLSQKSGLGIYHPVSTWPFVSFISIACCCGNKPARFDNIFIYVKSDYIAGVRTQGGLSKWPWRGKMKIISCDMKRWAGC